MHRSSPSTGLFVCAALVLALRRVSGALVQSLTYCHADSGRIPPAISALGIRTLWRHASDASASARGDLIMDILLGTSLPIFAAALSLPGTSAWGLACFWLLIAAFEIWAWGPRVGQWLRLPRHEKTGPEQSRIDQAQSVAAHIEPVSTLPGAISDSVTAPYLAGKRRNPATYPLDDRPGRRHALRRPAIGSCGRPKDGQFARGILPAVCRHAGDNRRASRRSRGADKDRPIAALRGPHGCKAHCAKRRTGRGAGAIYGPSRVLNV